MILSVNNLNRDPLNILCKFNMNLGDLKVFRELFYKVLLLNVFKIELLRERGYMFLWDKMGNNKKDDNYHWWFYQY